MSALIKPVLTTETARRLVRSAVEEAERRNWPCVVAVVDDGGWLLAFERMHEAPMLASTLLAQEKARSAAIFRKPTLELEHAVNAGRAAMLSSGLNLMQGGIPIVADKAVIGAIGISADTPDHDQVLAEAAVHSLERDLLANAT
jgi:glc operon protein GlcG